MSYDIELRNKHTNEVLFMNDPHFVRGGTVPAVMDPVSGELIQDTQREAHINITYNYGKYYYEATDGDPRFAHDEVSAYYADGTHGPIETEYGIRGLYGKTPAESIPMLTDMISRIEKKYKDKDGNWLVSERIKAKYYDKNGDEVELTRAIFGNVEAVKKEVHYMVSEGDTKNYWEATACNAIRPLKDMILMATDNILNTDAVWNGD